MPRDSIEVDGKRRTHEEEKKGTPAMNKISRKGFLKIAAAAAMSGVTAGALAACNSAASSSTAASGDAIYTAGTYTGTATGIGEVKLSLIHI